MRKLSRQTARDIEREINQITGEKINVMNDQGIIIVSSDPARVNTFHEGAKRIIEENLDELIVEYDGQYEGARRGANFPILVDNQIIGVIGITGPYEEIEKYGKLMKKMVEIFMLETYLKEQRQAIINMKQYFLNEWINSDNINDNTLLEKSKEFDIDLSIKRRFMIVFIEIKEQLTAYDELIYLEKIEEELNKIVNKLSNKSLILNDKRVFTILVTITSDEEIIDFSEKIKETLERKLNIRIKIGIGTSKTDLSPKEQRKTAKTSIQRAIKEIKKDIIIHSDLSVENLVTTISLYQQEQYVSNMTKKMSVLEVKSMINVLMVYYNYEGSLKKTAEKLNFHVNTLQYQLKSIKEKTGYDPRSLKDATAFTLLIEFYNNLS